MSRWVGIGPLLAVVLVACAPAARPAAEPPARPAAGAPTSGASAAPAPVDRMQELVEAARQEGQLNLVFGTGTLGGAEGIKRLEEGFNRHYGLNLSLNYTPGPSMSEMAPKLAQEYQAGRRASSDLLIGYGVHAHILSQADAAEPEDWLSWAPNIRNPEQVAANGTAVTFLTSIPVITYSAHKFTPQTAPRTLEELLRPEYRGRVASTIYAANFDYLATDAMWGEQRTMDYLTRFADQITGLLRCNETNRIVSGEFDALALDCNQANPMQAKAQGAPIDYVIPSDAPILTYMYLAVPRNAGHSNAAKLFVNYLLSREVQDQLYEMDFQDSHLVPGSRTAKDLEQIRATGVQFYVVNVDYVQRQDEKEFARLRSRALQIIQKK